MQTTNSNLKKRIAFQMSDDIYHEIIKYIPFESCNTCQIKINVLHKKNYYNKIKYMIFCSESCYNSI